MLDIVKQSSELLCDALSIIGVLMDNMCNIQMRNGQNKFKIWLQHFGFSHVQFVIASRFSS
jgi:hypothetical protein